MLGSCTSRVPTVDPTKIAECSSDGVRWDELTMYKKDDVVFYENFLYQAIQNGKDKHPVTWSTKGNLKQNKWINLGECANSFAPSQAPTWTSDGVDCLGPFNNIFPDCEATIKRDLKKKDSGWFAWRGMDGSRCSIQQWHSNPARGSKCPPVVEEDCIGPFPGYDGCEQKILQTLSNKDSAWLAFRGMDGSRCSIQEYYSKGNRDQCPKPTI